MKVAIILFNLGGPDSLEAVQPFLRGEEGPKATLDALKRETQREMDRFRTA